MTDLIKSFSRSGIGEAPCVFGVPRGGMLAVATHFSTIRQPGTVVLHPADADVIIDDIIDSGRTRDYYRTLFPWTHFAALVDKTKPEDADLGWVVFPWEVKPSDIDAKSRDGADAVTRILQLIGENPNREGLLETPERVVKTWPKLFGGYDQDPKSVFKTFEDGSCDGIVILRDCEFYSTCEHHMLPFFGRAHIGYLPKGKVVGVSKLARLLEVFARRLQIQERIGDQITKMLMDELNADGAGCVLEAQHFCMTSRGVEKQNSIMVTSSMRGEFRENASTRSEFLRLCGK
jgi:GTP cyclohydrolase I